MDTTLSQIVNDLVLAHAEIRRLRAIEAEHANCPKSEPTLQDLAGKPSAGVAIQEAAAVNGQSA